MRFEKVVKVCREETISSKHISDISNFLLTSSCHHTYYIYIYKRKERHIIEHKLKTLFTYSSNTFEIDMQMENQNDNRNDSVTDEIETNSCNDRSSNSNNNSIDCDSLHEILTGRQMEVTENYDPLSFIDEIFGGNDFNTDTTEQLLDDFDPTDFENLLDQDEFRVNLSEETFPVSNEEVPEVESTMSDEIPIDLKEWQVRDMRSQRLRAPRLLEFLVLAVQKPYYQSYASFIDRSKGFFQIHEPDKMAKLWGKVKNRQSHKEMTYDKLARGIRWNYSGGSMIKTNTAYTFQFSPKTMRTYYMDEDNVPLSFD